MKNSPTIPAPRFCATLWTLHGHPSAKREWSTTRKLEAMAAAGFDGVHDVLDETSNRTAQALGLRVIGRLDGRTFRGWKSSLRRQADLGVDLINVHLGVHDSPPQKAAEATAAMVAYGESLGVHVQVETHRDTATETPEKYDEIRRHYRELTQRRLPTTWDFSHFAVMKHLLPQNYADRLLAWPREIQDSRLMHCRPFNGQHAQIPVTNPRGQLTPEFRHYERFLLSLFTLWQRGSTPRPALWICPELGATEGYHLSTNPPIWSDTQRCLKELKRIWKTAANALNSKDPAMKSA